MLELQASLAGAVGHRLVAAGQPLPDLGRLLALLALERRVGNGQQRAPRRVVDELGVDVLQRAEHDQARALGRAGHRLANAEVPSLAPVRVRPGNAHLRHYLPPAFPAFRRTCSPWYLMPFPLYGSGGRRLRSSAATCPTFSLSAPSMMTRVGVWAVSLTPAGARYSTGCEKPSAN